MRSLARIKSGSANTTKIEIGNTANRGLEISTYQSAGNNDSGVVFNAADSENSGYSATLEFDLGGVEFGRFGNALILGDEFTPDGCRIWDVETGESLDKDRFRKDLGDVVESYQIVAHKLGITL